MNDGNRKTHVIPWTSILRGDRVHRSDGKKTVDWQLQITYYDKYGSPTVYGEGNNMLFLFGGHVAAFVAEGAVYSNLGIQIGWISNGWVRDLNGNAAFFAEGAFGVGSSIPYRQALPIRQCKVPFLYLLLGRALLREL